MPQWLLAATVALSTVVLSAPDVNEPWRSVTTADDSAATARHEAASVTVEGKFYLIGGRSERPVEVFDPATNSWRVIGPAPLEINHFQPVVVGKKIYLVAAFTGGYPNETNVPDVHVFDTETESWSTDGVIPEERRRGGAAAVYFGGKIYIVGGNTNGHNGGAVNWFDRFDPATDEWEILDDAPNARDHMQAALVGDKLIVVGGRQSTQPNPFINTVSATDIYDFTTGTWSSGADIPTDRAGAMTVTAGAEVIVAGGEVDQVAQALKTVEAYHVPTNSWRTLQDMIRGRHSGGGSVIGDKFHVVSGSPNRGGGQISSHETLALNLANGLDSDNDGLDDEEELNVYNTDYNNPDSDADGLQDGDEIERGTLPNIVDTDEDGLNDGEEVNTHGSDPLSADSDTDGLNDYEEITLHNTDPLNSDSDSDGLTDNEEINTHATDPLSDDSDTDGLNDQEEITTHNTDPLVADSDSDGLMDGDEITAQTDPLDADSDDDGINDGDDEFPLTAVKRGGGGVSFIVLIMLLMVFSRQRNVRRSLRNVTYS